MNKYDIFKGVFIGALLIAMGFGFNAANDANSPAFIIVGSVLVAGSLAILIFLPKKDKE